tara:strand:- start:4318 stop:4449 length:132 start_codon:yes stop_codon:yes gene_type:complete
MVDRPRKKRMPGADAPQLALYTLGVVKSVYFDNNKTVLRNELT